MKQFFLAFTAIVLVLTGAGCAASNLWSSMSGSENVEGPWRLAFDLPEGWVMVKEYDEPRNEAITPSQTVSHDLETIILQSTEKAIVESGTPKDSVSAETYVTSEYTMIRVDRLDARRVIPSNAEDLGNGFSVAEGKYYFQTSSGEKYQCVVTNNGGDENLAKTIILSAKLVTVFTDTQAAASGENGVQTNE